MQHADKNPVIRRTSPERSRFRLNAPVNLPGGHGQLAATSNFSSPKFSTSKLGGAEYMGGSPLTEDQQPNNEVCFSSMYYNQRFDQNVVTVGD